MDLTEEDIQEIIKALEERDKKLLQKQLFNLTLDNDNEKKEQPQELSQQIVTQNIKIKGDTSQQTKDSINTPKQSQQVIESSEQSVLRLKREKLREDLRKKDQESKFKLKRVISPSALSEVSIQIQKKLISSSQEVASPYKEEHDSLKIQEQSEEQTGIEIPKEDVEDKKKKEAQKLKKKRTRSRR